MKNMCTFVFANGFFDMAETDFECFRCVIVAVSATIKSDRLVRIYLITARCPHFKKSEGYCCLAPNFISLKSA